MAGKTNTDHILDLQKQVEQLTTRLDERSDRFKNADEEQRADIKALEKTAEALLQRTTALEQRCAALEKGGDRAWQVWLALGGAGLAVLISLVKK